VASIAFDDGSGSQTINSAWPAPANRFGNWIPIPTKIGERSTAVGDGARYQWDHRTDYGASFEFAGIARSEEGKLQDFKLWADAGGTFTVTTADSESNTYTDCGLAPGALVEIQFDRKRGYFTLLLSVIHLAASPEQLRCLY
jgi:hypothetical protein